MKQYNHIRKHMKRGYKKISITLLGLVGMLAALLIVSSLKATKALEYLI